MYHLTTPGEKEKESHHITLGEKGNELHRIVLGKMVSEVLRTARGKVANEFLRTTPGEKENVRQRMLSKEPVTTPGARASELHHIIRGEKGKGGS